MSPEQAKGRAAGPRADVWAFGCVLFEMLTGSRAFSGEDVTDTIVAVLSKEPDWQRLPASAAAARPLLARCLKKDSKQRLQAIGGARLQIDDIIRGTTDSPPAAAIPTTAHLGTRMGDGWCSRRTGRERGIFTRTRPTGLGRSNA